MAWRYSLERRPRLHANVAVCTAIFIVACGVYLQLNHELPPGQESDAALKAILVSYPIAAYGCGAFAVSKGYSLWWGFLPSILGLHLLALEHVMHLHEGKKERDEWGSVTWTQALSVFALMGLFMFFILGWGERISPSDQRIGRFGFVVCSAYLLCVTGTAFWKWSKRRRELHDDF